MQPRVCGYRPSLGNTRDSLLISTFPRTKFCFIMLAIIVCVRSSLSLITFCKRASPCMLVSKRLWTPSYHSRTMFANRISIQTRQIWSGSWWAHGSPIGKSTAMSCVCRSMRPGKTCRSIAFTVTTSLATRTSALAAVRPNALRAFLTWIAMRSFMRTPASWRWTSTSLTISTPSWRRLWRPQRLISYQILAEFWVYSWTLVSIMSTSFWLVFLN